ncbi:MAG: WD40 repeat domain-containing protein [Bacteroidia bacterium]|nr:WD40 repeat domain-containing protein [Bacteroidia bacterium]
MATWGFVLYWYELASAKLVWQYDLTKNEEYSAMNSVDISPDNQSIALATKDNRVRVINTTDGTLRYQIDPWKGHSKWVNTVQFSPDGRRFASAADDMYVMVWNTETGVRENLFKGHVAPVNSLRWSTDGKTLTSAARDGEVKVWSIENPGEAVIDACLNGPWYAPVSKNKSLMAAACSDKQLTVWDLRTRKQAASFSGFASNCAAFSDDERFVATGGHDAKVRWLDVETQQVVATMAGHTNSIYGIAYCPQQKLIASASADQTVRLWGVRR